MKLLMENWNKFLTEEEELEEGIIGKALGGLAIVAAGFFGNPAQAADNDVLIGMTMGGSDQYAAQVSHELKDAIYQNLRGTDFTTWDASGSPMLAQKAQTDYMKAADEGNPAKIAAIFDSNFLAINLQGDGIFLTLYSPEGNVVGTSTNLKLPTDPNTRPAAIDMLAKNIVNDLKTSNGAVAAPAETPIWTGTQER